MNTLPRSPRASRLSPLLAAALLLTGCPDEVPDDGSFAGADAGAVDSGSALQDGGGADAGPAADTTAGDASSPDAGGPDAGAPDASAPDVPAPDVSAPDTSAPDTGAADATQPDAGAPDTGPVDSGPADAGPVDAGVPDAGPVDAGAPDGGPADTGPTDTGPVDTGPSDTGPTDTGPADTGPADTGPADTGPADTGPADTGPADTGSAGCVNDTACTPTAPCMTGQCKAGTCIYGTKPDGASCGGAKVCKKAKCVAPWAKAIAAGWGSTCAVRGDGTVWCWGSNTAGQLGDGKGKAGTGSSAPVQVKGVTGAVSVTVGYFHACATTEAKATWCWGKGTSAQLGQGSEKGSLVPVQAQVTGATGRVSAGEGHSCVVHGKDASCWGDNNQSQVSSGKTTIPQPVKLGWSDVVDLAAGADNTCAIRAKGALSCWGSNLEGQLANGKKGYFEATSKPQPVTLPDAAIKVAVGGDFVCVLMDNQKVMCWGEGDVGKLGDGNTGNSTSPVWVSGVSGATDLDVGLDHGCVVMFGGQVWCWGRGVEGQLGSDPKKGNPMKLTKVQGISDAVAVATGGFHSCALHKTGAVSCWGEGKNGALGHGKFTASHVPVTVVGSGG